MNLHSSNAHAGDLIWALIALHRTPGEHVLRCDPQYVPALSELVEGTTISVEEDTRIPSNSMNCWIASGAASGVHYRDDIDITGFVQRYFNALFKDAKQPEPFPNREDMLCSFPSILGALDIKRKFTGILFINCDPKSGQCPGYSSSEMDALIDRTAEAGHSVCAVEKAQLNLVQIGALSLTAKLIVGCATGPWWPCQTVWNKDVQRICLLHPMRLNYGSACPTVHAKNAREVANIMEGMGFL